MVRAYTSEPVPPALVDRLLDLARRAPSAGNTQPLAFVVLDGPEQTARFWDESLPAAKRPAFRWPGLLDAPVLVLPLVRPAAYAERYREPDKAATGLGAGAGSWPVPYWWVDGGMAVMALLTAATDAGLGALLFGLFERERAVLDALGVPDDRRALGAIALGWPAADDRPGRSAGRPRPDLAQVVHRGRWSP
jgi:nitroreductase